MSGIRGRRGGWKIRWGVISSKCGIKYGCWGSYGNWWWVFMIRLGLYKRLGHLGLFWDGLYSQAALWEACWGVPFRGDAGLYRLDRIGIGFLGFSRRNWILCSGWYEEISLLLYGWDGWTGWNGGGMEGPTLAGAGTGAPQLVLEGRQAAGSGGWHQLRRCCKDAEYLC